MSKENLQIDLLSNRLLKKMQNFLFKADLRKQSLSSYISHINESDIDKRVTSQIKQSVNILNSFVNHGSEEQRNFFRNYKTLISLVFDKCQVTATNLALHWVNIYGQRLIQINKITEAKQLFECILSYLQNPLTDKILLCNALNNLALLYQFQSDFFRSFQLFLQSIQFCVEEIKSLIRKSRKQNKQKIETLAVILVNSLKNNKNLLYHFERDKSPFEKQDLQQIYQSLNKLGYESCERYLGKRSYFIRYFEVPEVKKLIQPPKMDSIKQSVIEIEEEKFKSFESAMLSRLEVIENMLKQKQTVCSSDKFSEAKQVDVIQTTSHAESMPPFQQKEEEQYPKADSSSINDLASGIFSYFVKGSKVDQHTFQMKGWNVQAQYTKLSGQVVGKVQFRCIHVQKNKQFTQKITERQLSRILCMASLQDTIPYSYSSTNLPPNFITVCIMPYFSITEEGVIQIFPRSKGILNQYLEKKFFGTKCFVSINHIRTNNFRISISPIQQSGSVYLNLQLLQETMQAIFSQLIDPLPYKIQEIHEKIFISKKSKQKENNFFNSKQIKIKDFQKLHQLIHRLVSEFQTFLNNQQDELTDKDIYYLIEKDEWFFKFTETHSQSKGIFYRVKFRKTFNSFYIYAENSYLTNTKEKSLMRKTKGSSIFSQTQFEEVFGFPINYDLVRDNIKRLEEIICYKYVLNTKINNEAVISQSFHSSQNQDNYIYEKSFNFHCFSVKFIESDLDNYLCVVTASIVTISNIFPIGIRITFYDPGKVQSKGYFINLCSQDWRISGLYQSKDQVIQCEDEQDEQILELQMFKKHQQKYSFKKNYWLGLWMQKEGFQDILSKVVEKNSNLYIEKNLNKIISWTKILQ